jgi:hypothetical protein
MNEVIIVRIIAIKNVFTVRLLILLPPFVI